MIKTREYQDEDKAKTFVVGDQDKALTLRLYISNRIKINNRTKINYGI